MRLPRPFLALPLALVAGALLLTAPEARAESLPVPVRGGQTISAAITGGAVADTDEYGIRLFPGDVLTVTARDDRPVQGLLITLSLRTPSGSPASAVVKRQGTSRPSLTFTAAVAGVHVVGVAGDPGGFGGSVGSYRLTLKVARTKPQKAEFAAAAGGPLSYSFVATEGALLTLKASTKKGGFDLTELRRPDGTPEPGFTAALKAKKRRTAKVVKLPLTGGPGTYEVRGAFDAGSKVKMKAVVVHDEKARLARLGDEPEVDTFLGLFPRVGIEGTPFHVLGTNFTFEDRPGSEPDVVPTFFLGGMEIPRASVEAPNGNGSLFRFPIPAGLQPGTTFDLVVVNADGQSAIARDAFSVAPPPVVTGLVAVDGGPVVAGPLGGRKLRIVGTGLRSGTLVRFGDVVTQPTRTVAPSRIDVTAPAHAPGDVVVTIEDEFGQTATVPGLFTYLDIGSNRITGTDPPTLQGIGGETVTVSGEDFGPDTVLTFDGQLVDATRVSPRTFSFVAPDHGAGTFDLRVTDQYEQTSALPIVVKGFTDATDTAIPTPHTGPNEADGWRGTRVLTGDLDRDGDVDLVLLRPEQAFGGDASRSRIRVLLGDGEGAFADDTATKAPGVTGDEDWRARDGALADLDGDLDLDLAIVTDDELGSRSSLRILLNDGTGKLVDATATSAPATSSWGDRNQARALAVRDVDGRDGPDIVLVHSTWFQETVVTPGGPGNPPEPPPIVTTFHYPATRVLLNDGSGRFTRRANALPAVDPDDASQYQGNAVAVGDVTGDGRADLVLTRDQPLEDPASPGTFLRSAHLLHGDGTGAFTDHSGDLPGPPASASGAEYLQGDRLELRDVDGDTDLDLVVISNTRLVSPLDGTVSTAPATRFFANSGGVFTPASSGLPAAEGADSLQADGFAFGDLSGDGEPEILLVSTSPPTSQGRGLRVLVKVGSEWVRGSGGLPHPAFGDDMRGADVALVDVDQDGDLDVVVVRDEPNETVRNTRVLVNPRK